MRTSCLITCYNYEKYILEAIDSALRQTVAFDEIIIIDDGSIDNSVTIINERYKGESRLQVISKKNQGQLSSFNEGYLSSKGDLIFFLDADDVYELNYLENALKYYELHKDCDFMFCATQEFGESNNACYAFDNDKDCGYTVVLSLYLQCWVGAATSCISIKRDILDKILPMPYYFLADWKIRADDILVWGASLAGARKYYINQRLVKYRVHENNSFCRKKLSDNYNYKRKLIVYELFAYFKRRFYSSDFDFLFLIKDEYKSIPFPTRNDYNNYRKVIKISPLSFFKKIEMSISLYKYYLKKSQHSQNKK